ncbi:MAG TPA: GH25 family lysozyme [Paludibacter sp.]|nr:GH25 family lysozyme [Paludibacter sp.]
MYKRLISVLFILVFAQFPGFARKSHRASHKKHTTTHKVQKVQKRIQQPPLTLNDLNPEGNVWGIDVSHYQSDINWMQLASQKPHFMFIKATEGISTRDSKYMQNYTEAKKLGILVGSYHFFSYKYPGREQANNFLSIAQHRDSDLLPVLDAEFTKVMPARELVIVELADFISTVYEKLGHYPIVYCNHRFYDLYLKDILSDKCKLWIVNYQQKPSLDWAFWQKTDRLKLAGINGFVDMNIFNGTTMNLANYLYRETTD